MRRPCLTTSITTSPRPAPSAMRTPISSRSNRPPSRNMSERAALKARAVTTLVGSKPRSKSTSDTKLRSSSPAAVRNTTASAICPTASAACIRFAPTSPKPPAGSGLPSLRMRAGSTWEEASAGTVPKTRPLFAQARYARLELEPRPVPKEQQLAVRESRPQGSRTPAARPPHAHDRLGVRVGQRSEQQAVNQAERRGVRADADGEQRDDRQRRGGGLAPNAAEREQNVAPEIVDPTAGAGVSVHFLRGRELGAGATRPGRVAGLAGRTPAR